MGKRNNANKIEFRAIYEDENGKKLYTQWLKIIDFDPDKPTQFDFDDGTYLCLNEVVWENMEWEYRIIK